MKKTYTSSLLAGAALLSALLLGIICSCNEPSALPLHPNGDHRDFHDHGTLVFKTGFEEYQENVKGDLKLFGLQEGDDPDWTSVGNPTAYFAPDPLKPGNRVVAVPLNYSDPVRYRTEIKLVRVSQFEHNGVYQIQFRIFIPTSWKNDKLADLIMQIHGQKDSGEFSRNPPISLLIEGDKLKLVVRGDRNARTRTNILTKQHLYTEPTRDYIAGTVEKGKWTKIRLEFLSRYDSHAWLKLWVNEKLAVRDNGANAYNDKKGGYFSLGNYKYPWRKEKPYGTSSRLHYIDDVEIHAIPYSAAAELKAEGS